MPPKIQQNDAIDQDATAKARKQEAFVAAAKKEDAAKQQAATAASKQREAKQARLEKERARLEQFAQENPELHELYKFYATVIRDVSANEIRFDSSKRDTVVPLLEDDDETTVSKFDVFRHPRLPELIVECEARKISFNIKPKGHGAKRKAADANDGAAAAASVGEEVETGPCDYCVEFAKASNMPRLWDPTTHSTTRCNGCACVPILNKPSADAIADVINKIAAIKNTSLENAKAKILAELVATIDPHFAKHPEHGCGRPYHARLLPSDCEAQLSSLVDKASDAYLEQRRRAAEEKARREAEAKARREQEEIERKEREAEEMARREQEEIERKEREAEEMARLEQVKLARQAREAEEMAARLQAAKADLSAAKSISDDAILDPMMEGAVELGAKLRLYTPTFGEPTKVGGASTFLPGGTRVEKREKAVALGMIKILLETGHLIEILSASGETGYAFVFHK